ncbi:hypothetical protein [Pleurocapsa sp. PCC 7319]|uniref:hypothetical protein n=1 Tax=Pleurocapsa sp. PCC 7319 TaxID=118161 RepID=UPI001181B475|nr:hypothetical protein [Pleurocapsa sp. PCC 7319]
MHTHTSLIEIARFTLPLGSLTTSPFNVIICTNIIGDRQYKNRDFRHQEITPYLSSNKFLLISNAQFQLGDRGDIAGIRTNR